MASNPAFFVFPLLYFAGMAVVVALVVVALWRGMKAQEEVARTLARIEEILSERRQP